MIREGYRHVAVVVLGAAVSSCGERSPTLPGPAFADVTFVYTSTLPVGDADPTEAGFCAHHALGASRLELWRDATTLDSTLYMRPDGEPPRAVVTAPELPVDTPFVVVVWDLQCCSHTGTCSPTEDLSANGVRLSHVVTLNDDGGRMGLAFRVRGDGVIVQ